MQCMLSPEARHRCGRRGRKGPACCGGGEEAGTEGWVLGEHRNGERVQG